MLCGIGKNSAFLQERAIAGIHLLHTQAVGMTGVPMNSASVSDRLETLWHGYEFKGPRATKFSFGKTKNISTVTSVRPMNLNLPVIITGLTCGLRTSRTNLVNVPFQESHRWTVCARQNILQRQRRGFLWFL